VGIIPTGKVERGGCSTSCFCKGREKNVEFNDDKEIIENKEVKEVERRNTRSE
jgi:hypothetical protein